MKTAVPLWMRLPIRLASWVYIGVDYDYALRVEEQRRRRKAG